MAPSPSVGVFCTKDTRSSAGCLGPTRGLPIFATNSMNYYDIPREGSPYTEHRDIWTVSQRRSTAFMILAGVFIAMVLSGTVSGDTKLVAYRIVDGTIPAPLTAQPGDPERGRHIVLDRAGGDCTICHVMPLPQREFH